MSIAREGQSSQYSVANTQQLKLKLGHWFLA